MSQNRPAKQSDDFFSDIGEILRNARDRATKALNAVMVEAYWTIGQRIVEEEQGGFAQATYGKGLLKELSKSLTTEFGQGFSLANLKNFRQFYLTYPEKGKSYTLCSFLSWSHNRLIMREKEEAARIWYLQESKGQNWSVRQLERQIRTQSYQRLLSSQSPAAVEQEGSSTLAYLKDPYVLEFPDVSEPPDLHEEELETALINDLQNFSWNLEAAFPSSPARCASARRRAISTSIWSFTTTC